MVSICESCLKRSYSNEPTAICRLGRCEVCGETAICSEFDADDLTPKPGAIEDARRQLAAEINANPSPRDALEAKYGVGNVWDRAELLETFDVEQFAAPFVLVVRKSDRKPGLVEFQHSPRLYYNFVEE